MNSPENRVVLLTSRQLTGPGVHIMEIFTRWFPVTFPKWLAVAVQKDT